MFIKLNEKLSGEPDSVISLALAGLGIAALLAAWLAPPGVKLAMLAWFAFP